jgi:predicted DNA-binding protein (MmcQ/YjbR family)
VPNDGRDAFKPLRTICLALPEAVEKPFARHDTPGFRVRDKFFAMGSEHDGETSVWCKAPPGAQEVLTGADPRRFFVPPYLGPKGWVGVRLDDGVDWSMVEDLVLDSYRMTAPKRLLAQLDGKARVG